MPADSLFTFAERTRSRLEGYPPQSLSETRAIVDSLLRALEWSPYVDTRTNVTVEGTFLEYVCLVDDVPALVVAVEAVADDLEGERLDALGGILTMTGIDRAIYTNGRDVVLLAGTDSIDHYSGSLLADTTLEYLEDLYGKTAIESHLARHSRRDVARKLALERESLEAALTRELLDVTGDSYHHEVSAAVTQLLDHLLESFADSQREGSHLESRDSNTSSVAHEPDEETAGVHADEGACAEPSTASGNLEVAEMDTDDDPDHTSAVSTLEFDDDETDPVSTAGADEQETDHATDAESEGQEPESADEPKTEASETEYVARFFSDRGSIGAVGHSDSGEALAHAAEFLFERGLSGIRLPWSPDADDSSEHDGGSEFMIVGRDDAGRLPDYRTLPNGTHINTSGTATDHARRLEALAARAGYRVMLTGDWHS
ncbi:hypothetical protein OB919_12090 [Halobacteria archaeon AArc-curdl1]|uniref:Uncharacterized protein n=1 Tax=Natronosalvus hydrolyticus TaxID=2979988 RepID=A0AAP2Z8V2_9EURY|nr:hypothetical protein [Halobacteria archaeon AArc-curdl1]